jgi:hypothetical protein
MEIQIKEGYKTYHYKIIDGQEWDKLNESIREIIRYSDEWRLAKLIRIDEVKE